MKDRDVARWVRCTAVAHLREATLATACLARTSEHAPHEREALALVAWLARRAESELRERARELFASGHEPEDVRALELLFSEADVGERPVAALRGAIDARLEIDRAHGDRLDAHTRLLVRIHRVSYEHLALPALATQAAPAWRDRFRDLYLSMLPAPRALPDDFLGTVP